MLPNPSLERVSQGEGGKVGAGILAQLLAADYVPSVWLPTAATNALRRQVGHRP